MKSADFTLAGVPSERSEGVRRPGQSQVRPKLRHPRAGLPAAPQGAERSGSRASAPTAPRAPGVQASQRREPGVARPGSEEPSTGVVRRVEPARTPSLPAPGARQERGSSTKGHSQILRRDDANPERAARQREDEDVRAWRCLEWGQPSREERPRRNPKVTIAQLSASGELVRQNGPEAWLPEAGDFMHRMSTLVARGLGFQRCRSICLKGTSTTLAISEVNAAKTMVVSGPHRSLANVLRRAGLE
jgi:hypothetical protein